MTAPPAPWIAAISTALFLAGCASSPTAPAGQDLTGEAGTECTSTNPDLQTGSTVLVKDAAGALLGKGTLGQPMKVFPDGMSGMCSFAFTVPGLPGDLDLYQVALATTPDKTVVYSRSDLDAAQWSIQLTVN